MLVKNYAQRQASFALSPLPCAMLCTNMLTTAPICARCMLWARRHLNNDHLTQLQGARKRCIRASYPWMSAPPLLVRASAAAGEEYLVLTPPGSQP